MNGRTERGFFECFSGGFAHFDGVISSKKEASKVTVSKSEGTVVVEYTDGHKYTYKADVTETADSFTITSENEKWE